MNWEQIVIPMVSALGAIIVCIGLYVRHRDDAVKSETMRLMAEQSKYIGQVLTLLESASAAEKPKRTLNTADGDTLEIVEDKERKWRSR